MKHFRLLNPASVLALSLPLLISGMAVAQTPQPSVKVVPVTKVAASPEASKAEAKAAPEALPEAVLKEMNFDAGSVSRGDIIKHDFPVENKGKGVLEITHVQPSCGCTVTQWDHTIQPGKSGVITASVNTAAFTGPIYKTISVATNDPKMSNFQLTIKADVKTVLQVSPSENAQFGLVFTGQKEEKVFTITSNDGEPFTITSVQSQDPNLQYSIESAKDHKSATFKVMLPADHPTGPIMGRFTLTTTHPKVPILNINVFGTIREPMMVIPQEVVYYGLNKSYVDEHPDDPSLNKVITIAYDQNPDLEITKVTSSLPNLETSVETLQPKQRYSIKLHLKPPVKLGDFQGTITIETNKKSITIPVRGKIF